jgi:hypothetical protein
MASVRIYFVGAGILVAVLWHLATRKKKEEAATV